MTLSGPRPRAPEPRTELQVQRARIADALAVYKRLHITLADRAHRVRRLPRHRRETFLQCVGVFWVGLTSKGTPPRRRSETAHAAGHAWRRWLVRAKEAVDRHGTTGQRAEQQLDGGGTRSDPTHSAYASVQSGAILRLRTQALSLEARERADRARAIFDLPDVLFHVCLGFRGKSLADAQQ